MKRKKRERLHVRVAGEDAVVSRAAARELDVSVSELSRHEVPSFVRPVSEAPRDQQVAASDRKSVV